MNVSRVAIVLIIALVGVLYSMDITTDRGVAPQGETRTLTPVEIRSYYGERLSSVNDFHENSISGPQQIDAGTYRLTIDGLTNRTMHYSYHDVLDSHPVYTKVITLHCVEGWDATILWEGVLVRDLIREAGADIRANTVILYARDGYSTSFPLEYFSQRDIIMAYRMNNVTLPAERGFPFQLVAEDKWGYKWIKWIERIELSDNRNYRGFWEQRGYSNTGDLTSGFFS